MSTRVIIVILMRPRNLPQEYYQFKFCLSVTDTGFNKVKLQRVLLNMQEKVDRLLHLVITTPNNSIINKVFRSSKFPV